LLKDLLFAISVLVVCGDGGMSAFGKVSSPAGG
jgi:hypothetical protein